jgi:HSP20 family protein
MTIMRFDPLREFDRVTEQLLASTRALRAIPMEAYRRGDKFYVNLDLPGVEEADVDVTVEGNMVNVRAQRTSPRQEGDELIVDERPQGTFARQLLLGENLDAGALAATYDHGVLTLTIPVSKAAQPRKVEIAAERQATAEGMSAETGGREPTEPGRPTP